MTEGIENIYAQLAKKIDDQARFTRAVTIICTLAILGVMFYTLTSIVTTLPGLVLAHFMGNLEQIVMEYRLVDNSRLGKMRIQPINPPAETH
jgi:hypothetical protein